MNFDNLMHWLNDRALSVYPVLFILHFFDIGRIHYIT